MSSLQKNAQQEENSNVDFSQLHLNSCSTLNTLQEQEAPRLANGSQRMLASYHEVSGPTLVVAAPQKRYGQIRRHPTTVKVRTTRTKRGLNGDISRRILPSQQLRSETTDHSYQRPETFPTTLEEALAGI